MARFVLVHGAWHGAWCFEQLAAALRERGHDVTAPDLPCDDVSSTAADYARVIGPQSEAIVVGHSLAGLTIGLVEARTRVYLGALAPFADVRDHCTAEGFAGFVRDSLDRSYWPDPDTTAERMYPDCTRACSDWAYPQLRHQARIEPVPAPFGAGDVVVATLSDAAVDPDWQVRNGRSHGARVIELEAGHSPFFTQPEELADLLSSLA